MISQFNIQQIAFYSAKGLTKIQNLQESKCLTINEYIFYEQLFDAYGFVSM